MPGDSVLPTCVYRIEHDMQAYVNIAGSVTMGRRLSHETETTDPET